jgi:uncharacterized low-complexity protein
MQKIVLISLSFFILILSGCGEKKEETSSIPGMKCGAGKCGANMFDGNSALAKKKKNILKQMRKDDPRKDCVINAKPTKATYNCVREPNGEKLTMKCGVGKCGDSMNKVPSKKEEPVMKCGAGKCGSSMD